MKLIINNTQLPKTYGELKTGNVFSILTESTNMFMKTDKGLVGLSDGVLENNLPNYIPIIFIGNSLSVEH